MTPFAQLKVIGARQSVELTAIVDTGFDGYVCLPTRLAVQLGLELTGEQLVELADGSRRNALLFAGRVEFFDEEQDVQMILTESEDALIGTRLLNQYRLSIEYPGGQTKLRTGRGKKRKPKRRSNG